MGLLKDRKSTKNVVARSRSIDVDAQAMPNIAKRFVESVVYTCQHKVDIHIMFFSADQELYKLQLTANDVVHTFHTRAQTQTHSCAEVAIAYMANTG